MNDILSDSVIKELDELQSGIETHNADTVVINNYDCSCDYACRDH